MRSYSLKQGETQQSLREMKVQGRRRNEWIVPRPPPRSQVLRSSPFCPRLKMVAPLGSSGRSPNSADSRLTPSIRETLGEYPRGAIFEMSATSR